MTYHNDFLSILKFASKQQDLAKIDYDFNELYPEMFTITEHYYALLGGLFCFGLSVILVYFIR